MPRLIWVAGIAITYLGLSIGFGCDSDGQKLWRCCKRRSLAAVMRVVQRTRSANVRKQNRTSKPALKRILRMTFGAACSLSGGAHLPE